jgi:hypothetical protein
MWFRTRRRLEDIERAIARIADRLEHLGEKPNHAEAGETFAKLLSAAMESQSNLVGSLGEIAVRSAARRAGIRGGTRRAQNAERDNAGKFLPRRRREMVPTCRLCADPLIRDPSIAEIQAHRVHEARRVNREASTQPSEPNRVEPDEPGTSGQDYRNGSEPG